MAHYHHVRSAGFLFLRVEAALVEIARREIDHIGSGTHDTQRIGFEPRHFGGDRRAVCHGRDEEREPCFEYRGRLTLQNVGILRKNRAALAFLFGAAALRRAAHLCDENIVGAEFVEERHHALTQPGEQRGYGHHRGDADHDPENGKQRAEPVGPHRREGHFDILDGADVHGLLRAQRDDGIQLCRS